MSSVKSVTGEGSWLAAAVDTGGRGFSAVVDEAGEARGVGGWEFSSQLDRQAAQGALTTTANQTRPSTRMRAVATASARLNRLDMVGHLAWGLRQSGLGQGGGDHGASLGQDLG